MFLFGTNNLSTYLWVVMTSFIKYNMNFRSTGIFIVMVLYMQYEEIEICFIVTRIQRVSFCLVFTNHMLYFSCSSSLFQHIEVQQRTLKIVNKMGKKTKNARSVIAQLSFFLFVPVSFLIFILRRIPVYSTRAANTKTMQAMSQASIAVSPSACNQERAIVI